MIDAATIKALIHAELEQVGDERVVTFLRRHLVEPVPIMVPWDYGAPGTQYLCWVVLEEPGSDVGIAYCEEGFGPAHPWGLLFIRDGQPSGSMGQDCAWFSTFLEAAFDSVMSSLPIWRVFKTDASGNTPISDEGGWDETWQRVMSLRRDNPEGRYDCDTSVRWRKG